VTTTGPSDTGTAAPGSVRARVVIVRDDVLALIERRRDGPIYSAFPGGAAEPGETPEAAARKAYEEPGLRVAISAALAEAVVGGTPGSGRGAEMGGEYPPARHLSRRLAAARRARAVDRLSPRHGRSNRNGRGAGLARRAVASA